MKKVSMTLQETRQGAEAASVSGRGAQTGAKQCFQGVGQLRLPWKGADPSVSVTGKRSPLAHLDALPVRAYSAGSCKHTFPRCVGVTCVALHATVDHL